MAGVRLRQAAGYVGVMAEGSAGHPDHDHRYDDYWRDILAGEFAAVNSVKRVLRSLPSPPRCKICQAPFNGPYTPLLRLVGLRRWELNQQICRICITGLDGHRGGAEVPVSLLATDVRGSTVLAEQMTPTAFTAALNRFFSVVFEAVDSNLGIIDHVVGDGVMAMWVPGFSGDDHAERAVTAGRELAASLVTDPSLGEQLPAGVGVHTGVGYVGVVGDTGSLDFTVLGDVANTAARLGSASSIGELVLSDQIVAAAGIDTATMERRSLELKGKVEPFPAWVEHVPSAD